MASYEQNSKKRWSVRWREVDLDGVERNRSKGTFATRREAQQWYKKYETDRAARMEKPEVKQMIKESEAITVEQLAAKFLEYNQPKIKKTSYLRYCKDMENICDALGDEQVAKLTRLQLENYLYHSNYSRARTEHARLVKLLFGFGEEYLQLPNPAAKVKVKNDSDEREKMTIWTPEQFERFFAALPTLRYKTLFAILYLMGLRIGEACPLLWSDIDFDKKTLDVNKTYTLSAGLSTPKTKGSVRSLIMPESLVELLRKYQQSAEFDAVKLFPPRSGNAYCLSHTRASELLHKYGDAVGNPRIRLHDMRHSCASYLISSGVPIPAVSAYLGHANVATTLNIYAHLLPRDETYRLGVLSKINIRTSDVQAYDKN